MAFLDKVKNLVAKNADKANTAIDKAGDMVDKRTQGKYAQQVDKAQQAAKDYVDKSNPEQPQQKPQSQQSQSQQPQSQQPQSPQQPSPQPPSSPPQNPPS